MSGPERRPMGGRDLGPWRLRPERQGAGERVWTVSLEFDDGSPPAASGIVAEIAWRRASREWVLEGLPPLTGLRAGWAVAGEGDWPPTVPRRVWRSAVVELGAWGVALLLVTRLHRSDSGVEASA